MQGIGRSAEKSALLKVQTALNIVQTVLQIGQGCTVVYELDKNQNPPFGSFVQTERKAHEAWDLLIRENPAAARVMHRLVSLMDKRGAVVVSQKTLAELLGVHRNTIGKAVKVLEQHAWIDTTQLGGSASGVKAYVVNRRVAWADRRENQRFAIFDARVVVSASEQSVGALEARDKPLIRLPRAGEYQLPAGDGSIPPSQPAIEGLEPDLPATSAVEGDLHLQQSFLED